MLAIALAGVCGHWRAAAEGVVSGARVMKRRSAETGGRGGEGESIVMVDQLPLTGASARGSIWYSQVPPFPLRKLLSLPANHVNY